jgi:hypothetical protein
MDGSNRAEPDDFEWEHPTVWLCLLYLTATPLRMIYSTSSLGAGRIHQFFLLPHTSAAALAQAIMEPSNHHHYPE